MILQRDIDIFCISTYCTNGTNYQEYHAVQEDVLRLRQIASVVVSTFL